MDWYIVVKTINGHRYRYRQKTWREGNRVRTRSEYIGPADDAEPTRQRPRDTASTQSFQRQIGNRVKESLEALMGRCSVDWNHAWNAKRSGPSLVKKDRQIEKVLHNLNVQWTHSTRGAFYSPNDDVVNIPPTRCFIDKKRQSATQAYYMVLFHELVHWTLHASRLNRRSGIFGDAYAKEELVAELGAVVLTRHFGIEVGDTARHGKYFQTWLERTDNEERALTHAKKEAARAVQYIINHGNMNQ